MVLGLSLRVSWICLLLISSAACFPLQKPDRGGAADVYIRPADIVYDVAAGGSHPGGAAGGPTHVIYGGAAGGSHPGGAARGPTHVIYGGAAGGSHPGGAARGSVPAGAVGGLAHLIYGGAAGGSHPGGAAPGGAGAGSTSHLSIVPGPSQFKQVVQEPVQQTQAVPPIIIPGQFKQVAQEPVQQTQAAPPIIIPGQWQQQAGGSSPGVPILHAGGSRGSSAGVPIFHTGGSRGSAGVPTGHYGGSSPGVTVLHTGGSRGSAGVPISHYGGSSPGVTVLHTGGSRGSAGVPAGGSGYILTRPGGGAGHVSRVGTAAGDHDIPFPLGGIGGGSDAPGLLTADAASDLREWLGARPFLDLTFLESAKEGKPMAVTGDGQTTIPVPSSYIVQSRDGYIRSRDSYSHKTYEPEFPEPPIVLVAEEAPVAQVAPVIPVKGQKF